jgi:ribosomal protein L6P/L9E
MIISNKLLRVLFNILNKMVIGVLYGWYFCLNIVGRGFTFKIKKKNGINFLKLKIGYSHFLYYKLNPNIMLKISKKKNKLFLFCLDFWLLSKFVYQIRNLRSKHTYKLQGIHFFNEKIVVKPGKKKQV